ncbi:hypothetical protein [Bacteroides graminisolvens]
MTYLEAVALLHDIESKYDVMNVKYKGVSVWSFLRLRLLDCVSVNTEIKISRSIVKTVFKSLFYGSPFLLWGKYDLWSITNAERRKMVGNKMIHRISGAIEHLPYTSLMIEKPSRCIGHAPKRAIEETHIFSESWILLLSQFFMHLSLVKKKDVQGCELMDKILEEYNLKFDYMHYICHLDAQRRSMNFILAISKKPNVVLFECPYDSMGYQWAFYQHGIKVVELQHGVLNRNHDAYNAKDYEPILNPDAICVFGIEEYNYFKEEAPRYAKDVYMTGLYMLEKADQYFEKDIFVEKRKKYSHIVVASGQAGYEEQLSDFINKVATKHTEALFVYIPRHNDVKLKFTCDNIQVVVDVNIYKFLKWADLHITISSTTCLEAHYFHKPTLFYNYENRASTYYKSVLKTKNGVDYIDSVDSFDEAYLRLLNEHFEYKEIFVHNNIENLTNVINNNIMD